MCLFLFVIVSSKVLAQSEDFQSWTMLVASKKFNSKTTSSLATIFRFDEKVSAFNDISFDWKIKRKLKYGLSAQFSFRNWTFEQRTPVYFFWYDLFYVQNKTKYKWVSIFRGHHGLDWVDREQADFIRWRNFYYHKFSKGKLLPYVGYDLWYRLNDFNAFQIIWLESGFQYKIDKAILQLGYRRITYFKDVPGLRRHIILTKIQYDF